uniref:Uncharacterized protein n=1 Tax=Lepeophtheirus salmonis TaxID=72036 RepID=A0A0K2TY46_LEPSM
MLSFSTSNASLNPPINRLVYFDEKGHIHDVLRCHDGKLERIQIWMRETEDILVLDTRNGKVQRVEVRAGRESHAGKSELANIVAAEVLVFFC